MSLCGNLCAIFLMLDLVSVQLSNLAIRQITGLYLPEIDVERAWDENGTNLKERLSFPSIQLPMVSVASQGRVRCNMV